MEVFQMNEHSTQGFDKSMVMVSFIVSAFTAVVGPLILWVLKKDEDPATAEALRHVANFGLSYTIYGIVAGLLTVVLIGAIIGPIIGLAFYIFLILGAVKAYNGEMYKPPFTLDIIK